jgi:excisionase family DNA binding protein
MARLEIVTDSQSVTLPDDLAHTLTQVVETIANGGRVVVNSVPNELTTTFAAKILGVSRPTVMKLINEGELPAHKVGTHHRLKLSDVQDFKRSRLLQQREAIDALMELSDELGQIS